MRKLSIFAVALFAVLLFALPSEAVSPLRKGQKGFERGWNLLSYTNRDAAVEEFAGGADGFAEALAENPRSRATNFDSNIARAGMTFYFAGRYQEAVDVLTEAYDPNSRAWETALYTAMSYAAMGNAAKTKEWLEKFLDMHSGERYIANEAVDQLEAMENGSVSMESVAAAMDASVMDQIRNNVRTISRKTAFPGEGCSGTYWWRNARTPCTRRGGFID